MTLEGYFPYRLAMVAEAFSQTLVEVYGGSYGLSREEWRLLFLLVEAGKLTSHDLAQRTTLDRVQISRASHRLAAKGLITRRIAPADRRLRLYTCTDTGRALFDEVFPQVDARANAVLSRLSDADRAALMQGVEALMRAVQGPDAPPVEAGSEAPADRPRPPRA